MGVPHLKSILQSVVPVTFSGQNEGPIGIGIVIILIKVNLLRQQFLGNRQIAGCAYIAENCVYGYDLYDTSSAHPRVQNENLPCNSCLKSSYENKNERRIRRVRNG